MDQQHAQAIQDAKLYLECAIYASIDEDRYRDRPNYYASDDFNESEERWLAALREAACQSS